MPIRCQSDFKCLANPLTIRCQSVKRNAQQATRNKQFARSNAQQATHKEKNVTSNTQRATLNFSFCQSAVECPPPIRWQSVANPLAECTRSGPEWPAELFQFRPIRNQDILKFGFASGQSGAEWPSGHAILQTRLRLIFRCTPSLGSKWNAINSYFLVPE